MKKSKKILIIVIPIILIILSTIGYFIYKSNILEYKKKIVVEVGSTLPTAKDYLYKKDNIKEEIVWNNLETADDKVYTVGVYTGTLKYKDKNLTLTLVVEDTTPPIISGVKDITITAYEELPDFQSNITVSDNSMTPLTAEVVGDYNPETAGDYTLYYVAKDPSGNETKKEFKLTVKENPNVTTSKSAKGYTIKNYHGITYLENNIIANKTYSLPSNYVPSNLVTINGYIKVVDTVKDAFLNLTSDAKSIGLNIYASSGYRSYQDQNYIYNGYVARDGAINADTYSARAGYSEHQTGLAIDVNSVDMTFDNTSESNWLKDNCYKYGFIIRYPKDKDTITGYMYEPWHIRYVGNEFAEKLYNSGNWITLEEYYGIDSKYN